MALFLFIFTSTHAADVTAPVLVGVPFDVSVECSVVPPPASVSATDEEDPNPTVTLNEIQTPGVCPGSYTLTRLWTAQDASGNVASNTQIITVSDTIPPTLSGQGRNRTINCPETPFFTGPTANDNCDSAPTITFTDTTTPGAGPGNYTVTRTWLAFDHCSNISASVSQTIAVQDVAPPEIICPTNRIVESENTNGTIVQFSVGATDDCGIATLINCLPESGAMFPIGTNTVQCTAADSSGNIMSCEFTVAVLGALGVKRNVLAELMEQRAATARLTDQTRLDKAIEHLTSSTEPSVWFDESRPLPDSGRDIFNRDRDALQKLTKLLKDPRSLVSKEVLADCMARVVKANRLVAEFGLNDFASSGGAAQRAAAYREEIRRGNTAANSGRFTVAITHFRKAWTGAVKSQPAVQ